VYRAIAANKRNTVFIIALFVIILAALGWVASLFWGGDPLVVTGGTLVGAGIFTLIQYFAAGRQALAISGAREIQKADNPRFFRVVENLSITNGMPMPRVYVIDDEAPNAFATGRDPKHAVVAATTGLLAIIDDAELEGVMAHELGHVQNYDIRVSTIVFGLVVAVGFIADILLRFSLFGGNRNNNNNNGGGNPILLVLGLVALIVSPLVAGVVQAAVSRQREYLADATGAMTTRHPDALASALQKLEAYGRPVRRQNTSMAHMWIADPNKPSVVQRLFSTHPPIAERVERLREIGGGF
jgi:heat shock protein HtpX